MAQVTIYLNDEIAHRVESAAKEAGVSTSSWVRARLEQSLSQQWPEGYFNLFGCLADSDLERPEQPSLALDLPREAL